MRFRSGWPFKNHAEHVVHFALHPVRRGPDALHAGHALVRAGMHLQAQPLILFQRIHVQHDVEPLLALRPIDGREVAQPVKFLIVPAVDRNFGKQFARDDQNGLFAIRPGFQDGRPEFLLVSLHEIVIEGDRAFFWRSAEAAGGRGRQPEALAAGAPGRSRQALRQEGAAAAGGAGGLDAGSPPAAGVFGADGSVGELADGCFSSGSFAMN